MSPTHSVGVTLTIDSPFIHTGCQVLQRMSICMEVMIQTACHGRNLVTNANIALSGQSIRYPSASQHSSEAMGDFLWIMLKNTDAFQCVTVKVTVGQSAVWAGDSAILTKKTQQGLSSSLTIWRTSSPSALGSPNKLQKLSGSQCLPISGFYFCQ